MAPLPPPYGGIASWAERMLNAKLKNNVKIEVVDEKVIGGREVFGGNTKKQFGIELKRHFNIWKNLIISLRDPEAKIVHSCIPSATLSMVREYICACITKFYKRKFIIHFRCTIPNVTKTRISKFILKKLCKKSDKIIVLNKQSKLFLENVTEKPVTIIPNFIETKEISSRRTINPNINRVLYVGGVTPEKGCLNIVEVAREFPEIEFRMIGKIDDLVLKVSKDVRNVVLTGPKDRDKIQDELSKADAFMFLSYYSGEGFSNALLEAMASGLPCIVSDWAANADMIGDSGGYVVPLNNSKDASLALKKTIPYAIRKKQSEFNIEKVKELYSDTVVLSKYVDAYENCVNTS